MKRAARLDGTNDSGMYSSVEYIRDPRGLTKEELLAMRETGMSNPAIARAVNSKAAYITKLIGKTPAHILKQAQIDAGKKGGAAKWRNARDGKAAALPAAKPDKHVEGIVAEAYPISGLERLSRLRAVIEDLRLQGDVFDYCIIPGLNAINISWHGQGAVLFSIKFEHVEVFIEELMDVMVPVKEFRKAGAGAAEGQREEARVS